MSKELDHVQKGLDKAGLKGVAALEWHDSVILRGKARTWEEKIKAGYSAAHKGYKGVVNDLEVEGLGQDKMYVPPLKDNLLEAKAYDVAIIGGGIMGCAIARELTRQNLKIALLEKEEDLAKHASSRNDGMIHPALAPTPGTKKALYNLRGNQAYTRITRELGIEFKRPGLLILYKSPFSKYLTPLLARRAGKNGVTQYRYLNPRQVRELEPFVTPLQHGAFFLPQAGILCPYRLTIAYAENAIQNGAQLFLNCAVLGFERHQNRIEKIRTNRGELRAKLVINAAGIWADLIAGFAQDRFFSLHGRKGMDALLDKKTAKYQTRIMSLTSFLQMGAKTKGGGIVPTIEGNILIGPTAKEVPYREDYSTSSQDMEDLLKRLISNPALKKTDIITYFAGIRACTYEEDFVIEASEYVENLIHVAGIQSPGLASAPAIAQDVAKLSLKMLQNSMKVRPNSRFNPIRMDTPLMNSLNLKERASLIKKEPSFGRIVCRCETISEGDIKNALQPPLAATTLDGIKRRTRAGMGRCHGGFCTPRVMEIIAQERRMEMTAIQQKGYGSQLLLRETKGEVEYPDLPKKSFSSGVKEIV